MQAGDECLTVSFSGDTHHGTDEAYPITGYVVRLQPGDREVEAVSSPCVITGLTNGKAYRVSVAAVNAMGRSRWSEESAEAIPGERTMAEVAVA